MINRMTILEMMSLPDRIPVADVRTPAEFLHGHIPGALNLPLFSNEERVQVGTVYKQTGKEAAVLLGFDLCGTKWSGFIRQALEWAPDKRIAVHCWRGGMRSGAMAWALDMYGFEVSLVQGGYKSYRRWALRQFTESYPLWVIGGLTGSGKTRILHALRSLGEQVIDLEGLAGHQGSSYGTMNRLIQPTQEQFENDLARVLVSLDRGRRIWIEDESITIGRCVVPKMFWEQLIPAWVIDLRVAEDQRIRLLVDEYGSLDKEFLVVCTERIRKRLGTESTKEAIDAIRDGRMEEFIRLVLVYYDKMYSIALRARKPGQVLAVKLENDGDLMNAGRVLEFVNNMPMANMAGDMGMLR
jgi:tRNA 2-selenouridine synthase